MVILVQNNLSNYNMIYHDRLDSTSDEAKRLIESNFDMDRNIIIANQQDNGHGRYGRRWQSPIGNLYASLIIKLDDNHKDPQLYSFVAALAVGTCLQDMLDKKYNIAYKWPNDILVSGKKICGILLQLLKSKDLNSYLIIGIGLNINTTPLIDGIKVISIKDCEIQDVNINIVVDKIVANFDKIEKIWQKDGFSHIRKIWLEKAYKIENKIDVNIGNRKISGIFKGLTADGRLQLVTDEGNESVSSGEVFFKE